MSANDYYGSSKLQRKIVHGVALWEGQLVGQKPICWGG